MPMSRNIKISVALIAVFVAVAAAIGLAIDGEDQSSSAATSTPSATASTPSSARVVASDPRRLGALGTTGVTFTEFLDFECESCAAAFPVIEQLRREYAGRVTFNLRYFPIDSHKNARNAALAVEAAAQQGKLEEMYKRMYETQPSWAEQSKSQASVFRGFAKDLRLNMKRYDAAVADPKTAERVERDVQAGKALGVQGTPTFFVNEQMIQPQSVEEIRQLIDDAVGGA